MKIKITFGTLTVMVIFALINLLAGNLLNFQYFTDLSFYTLIIISEIILFMLLRWIYNMFKIW